MACPNAVEHQSRLSEAGRTDPVCRSPPRRFPRRMTTLRRLAAILAADVAGYSRLIGADEEGTLDRLRSIRAEVVDPSIAQYRGRIVKTTGDGLLVEFSSVVGALRCASEIQGAMAKGNAEIAVEKRIEFEWASMLAISSSRTVTFSAM